MSWRTEICLELSKQLGPKWNLLRNFFLNFYRGKNYMYIPMMESSSWYLLFATAITFSSWLANSALIIELLALSSIIEELVLISSAPMVSFLSSFWYDSTISSLDPFLKNKINNFLYQIYHSVVLFRVFFFLHICIMKIIIIFNYRSRMITASKIAPTITKIIEMI